jgi:hypothetical protein
MDEINMAAPQPEVTAIPPNLIFENVTTKHLVPQDLQEHRPLQNPFPQAIKISRYTKDSGPLTKVMRLVDGTLCKDGSGCRMNRGKVEQCSLGSMSELALLLQSLGLNQAVSLGVTDSDSVKTITTKDKETGDAISRTKRHIMFRPNEPAFMLFDHDQSRDNAVFADAKAGKGYRPEILMEIVADLFPPIRHASWLMRPSTSACIYDQSGNLLKGEGSGFHIYLPVKDGSDIPRFLDAMGNRLIIAGSNFPVLDKCWFVPLLICWLAVRNGLCLRPEPCAKMALFSDYRCHVSMRARCLILISCLPCLLMSPISTKI